MSHHSKPCPACAGAGQIPVCRDPDVTVDCSRCAGRGKLTTVEELLVTLAETNGIPVDEMWEMDCRDFTRLCAAKACARVHERAERITLVPSGDEAQLS